MNIRYLLAMFISLPILADTISISFKNIPVSEAVRFLAEETGKNIVMTDEIKNHTTLILMNSHFEQVINSIAKINQLTLRKEGDIFYLNKKSAENSTPITDMNKPKLITKTLKLYYAKASEVFDSLTKGNGQILAENGYLHFDDRSNSLIIKDSPQAVRNLIELIKKLDQPTEQIAIEARIVTISSENLKELGVRWGMFTPNENHHKFAGNLAANGLNSEHLNVNFPINSGASALLQIATINSRVLDLELTALERENNVEIIASPRLLTTNKKSASIKQGTEIPYAIYSQKEELKNIEFREAVLGLEVTPHISKNNQILLDLLVSQNSPNNQSNSETQLITIDKQEINTQVFAKSGETIVLGGIFQHLITKGEDRVPILGSIPVIKKLFSQHRDKIGKRELVIFVTPYIIKSPQIDSKVQKLPPK